MRDEWFAMSKEGETEVQGRKFKVECKTGEKEHGPSQSREVAK